MKKNQVFLPVFLSMLIIGSSFSIIIGESHSVSDSNVDMIGNNSVQSVYSSDVPSAIMVTDANPFYALIATPLAIRYDSYGNQQVIPMYVLNFDDPSSAVIRAQEQIGIYPDLVVSDLFTPKETSMLYATLFWSRATSVLLIKDDHEGYNLGVMATPLASYLGIPILVTDTFDNGIRDTFETLQVDHVYLCGEFDIDPSLNISETQFNTVEEIVDEIIQVHDQVFNEPITYLTLTNPMDVHMPSIIDTYDPPAETNTISSGAMFPSQLASIFFNPVGGTHTFTIPSDFKYARVSIDLVNLHSSHVEELGDELVFLLVSPEDYRYTYGGTMGGIPERDASGDITKDKLHYETIIYDNPGEYQVLVYGKWFARKTGAYSLDVKVEKLSSPFVPLMKQLSSMTPYITAYHKGIIFGKPEFSFAADDDILFNGEPCPGITQPGSNPALIEPSNQHTFMVHDQVRSILSKIAGIPDDPIQPLRDFFVNNPINIAIAADPTMIPMYFYYNPDGRPDNTGAYMMGFALPSDFIYGNIDPDYQDPENDTIGYWPFQENCVARLTGRDVQDLSALIARTIYYDQIISSMNDWKNQAYVGTGCGLEFQNLPILTRLSHIIYGGRGEPTKFPTGESTFINLRLTELLETGFSSTRNTFLTASQREGFSKEDLSLIKNTGILNQLLFPSYAVYQVASDKKVTGGKDHQESNLIFCFAHGSYNLFEHGDILMDARGFPFLTMMARIYPPAGSGLNAKGAFDVRGVDNMEYGPSVMFVVSCITGRTDGLLPNNTISQAFLHAGVNAYVGATRVTADPGYLEPRPLPGGWGIGTLGLIKATLDLLIKDEYPDFHFGAVIGEDFIKEMINNDASTGLALRNAKNMFLPKDANSTFLWTPPLMFSTGISWLDEEILSSLDTPQPKQGFEETRVLDKKYVALHEFTLYGDPAFNPYQTWNNG
jgi:peptidase C25-like protein